MSDVAEIADGQIAFVAGTPESPVPTLRDARTGKVAWTGRPLPGPGAAVLLGPIVGIVELDATAIYRRDGTYVGDAEGEYGFAATFDAGRMYMGASEAVICAAVTGPSGST